MTTDDDLLRRYHAKPGQTPRMLQPWRDRRGRSSYEALADTLEDLARESRVLDLCCGDGFLLSKLERRGFTRLVGLDQSPHELDAARQRLGARMELTQGDARELPFRTASFDAIVSHMALMLIAPLDPVVAEIARVARPGARVAILIGRLVENEAYAAYRYYLHKTTLGAGMQRLQIGDPRMHDPDELRMLFSSPRYDPESLTIEDSEVELRAPGPVLWSLLRPMYNVYRLPEAAHAKLERLTTRYWASIADDDGCVHCAQGVRLLTVRTAAAPPGDSRTSD